MSQVGNDSFTEDPAHLIHHEHGDQIDSQHDDVQLVNPNVEEVELEVGELENEPLDEHRVVVAALSLVVLHVCSPVGHFAEINVHDDSYDGLSDRKHHVHVAFRVENGPFVCQRRQLGHVEEAAVVVGSDHSRGVEEAYDDEAADAPARETHQEAQHVLDKTLLSRVIGVRAVCHRVDAGHTLELFAQVFGIVLNNVVVPENVEAAAVSPPAYQENCAPQRHHNGEDTREGRLRDIEHELHTERH